MTPSFGFDFSPLPKRQESSESSTFFNTANGHGTTSANIQLRKHPGSSIWTVRLSREHALAQDLNQRLNQIPLPVPVYSPALMGTPKHPRRSTIFNTLRRKTMWSNPGSRRWSPPRSPMYLNDGVATAMLDPIFVPEDYEETVDAPPPDDPRYGNGGSGENGNCLNAGVDGGCSDADVEGEKDDGGRVKEEDRPSSPYSKTKGSLLSHAGTGRHGQAAGTTMGVAATSPRMSHIKPQVLTTSPQVSSIRRSATGDDSSSVYSADDIEGDATDLYYDSDAEQSSARESSIYEGDSTEEAVVSSAFAMPVGPAISLGKARVLRARQISVHWRLGRYTSVPATTTKQVSPPTPNNPRGPGIAPVWKRIHPPLSPDISTKRGVKPGSSADKEPAPEPADDDHHPSNPQFADTSSFRPGTEESPPVDHCELSSISDIMIRRQSKNTAGEAAGLQLLVSTLFDDSSDEEELQQQPPYISEEELELSPRQQLARRYRDRDHRHDHYNVNRNSVISTSSSGLGSDICSPTSRVPGRRKYSYTSTSTAPTAYSVHSLDVPSTAHSSKRFSIVISEPGADGDDELSPRFPRTYEFPLPAKGSAAELGIPDSRRSSTISYEEKPRAPSPRLQPLEAPRRADSRQSLRAEESHHSLRSSESRKSLRGAEQRHSIRSSDSRQSLRGAEQRHSIRSSDSRQSLRASSRMEIESERRRGSSKPSPHQNPVERELTRKISWLTLQQRESLHLSEADLFPEDRGNEKPPIDEYHKHISMSSREEPSRRSIPPQLASSAKLARMLAPEPSPVLTAFTNGHLSRPKAPNSPQTYRFPANSHSTSAPSRNLSKPEKLTGASASQLWPGPAPRRQRRRTASSDCIDVEIESNIRGNTSTLRNTTSIPELPVPTPIAPSRKSSRHDMSRKEVKQRPPPPPLASGPPMMVDFGIAHPPHGHMPEGRDEGGRKGHRRSASGETTRTRIAVNGFWDADSFGRMVLPGLPVDMVQAR